MIGIITLLMLLLIPLNLIFGSNVPESNGLDSFPATAMLLPEIRQLIKEQSIAVPDATFVQPAPMFHDLRINDSEQLISTEQKWDSSKTYLKSKDVSKYHTTDIYRSVNDEDRTLIKQSAIVPEAVQVRELRKKRKNLLQR
jgi:hypothetical protein